MRWGTLVLLLGICSFFSHESYAQTPARAIRYFEAGEQKRRNEDWAGAVEDFTKAIELNARLDSTKLRSKNGTNQQALDQSQSTPGEVAVSDSFTAYAYTNRGVARFYMGDFEAALTDFERALRIKPKLAEAYSGRAAARIALGDHDGALLDLERALSINHKLVEVYNNRGYLLIEREDFAKAIENFDRAIELKPTMASAHQGRGITFMKQGRFDLAVRDFTSTLKLNPGKADVYGNRALALMMLGREQEALTDLQKCIELDPELKTDIEERMEIAKKLKLANDRKVP